MKKVILFAAVLLMTGSLQALGQQKILEFEFEGVTLNGVLSLPENTPKGIVLIVHGSGQTNAVVQDWHSDVRRTLVQAGYGTYMWDKMGCGKSGGTFNYNQPVQHSAQEVIAAIHMLQAKAIPGSKTIGLWGISRAGWINPIVINEYQDIAFWISVSGVDEKENFKYLLEQNLRINGLPKDSVDLIVHEWAEGGRITHSGGTFEEYIAATKNLRLNKFFLRFTNNWEVTEAGYYAYQKTFMQEGFDAEEGLQIYIQDFESILSNIDCPVLALFGAQDMNVDWTKTRALYEKTLAPNTDLTIRSFPNCNHNLFQCKTGGFYEMQDDKLPWNRCDGFLEAMADWLREKD